MTNKTDFDSTAFRKKYAGWTESERQEYFEGQRQRLISERAIRAKKIEDELAP